MKKDKDLNIQYTPNTDTPLLITLFHEGEDTTDYKTHPNLGDTTTSNNHFQTPLNENYILISEMLKCEEEEEEKENLCISEICYNL